MGAMVLISVCIVFILLFFMLRHRNTADRNLKTMLWVCWTLIIFSECIFAYADFSENQILKNYILICLGVSAIPIFGLKELVYFSTLAFISNFTIGIMTHLPANLTVQIIILYIIMILSLIHI